MLHRFLPYLFPHRNRVGYIGWTGHDNLGDEALALAIEGLLPSLQLAELKLTDKVERYEAFLGGQGIFKGVMLGGGTLINAPATLETFTRGVRRYGNGVVFGSGVQDPAFWAGRPGWVDERDRWVELMQGLPLRAVRGPHSRALLIDAGLDDIEVVGDPALALADDEVTPKTGRRRIGLNVGTSVGAVWGSEDGIADWAVAFVDALVDRGWEVVLVPVWSRDVEWTRAVAARASRPVPVFDRFLNVEATLALLRTLDVFVGQKLHSVVFAHCVHTPAIALEYRPKCSDYMASVGQEHRVFRTDRLDVEAVLAAVDEAVADTETIQAELASEVSAARRRLEAFAARVSGQIEANGYPRIAASVG
ncbi:MAG: polysaccharide pyruvyl transferase family protein [Longimicrobiales bacterium]